MTKRICKDCKSSDWEEITQNFVHDEPNITLFQCKRCKRVVAFDPDEDVYEYENYTVLEQAEI